MPPNEKTAPTGGLHKALDAPAQSVAQATAVVVVRVDGQRVKFRCVWCSTRRRDVFHYHGAPEEQGSSPLGFRRSHCPRFDGEYELVEADIGSAAGAALIDDLIEAA